MREFAIVFIENALEQLPNKELDYFIFSSYSLK